MPVLILSLLVVLFLILTNFVNWVDGLYLATIALIVLYGFSILYRRTTSTYIDDRTTKLKNDAIEAETNYVDNFAYWIQGFFGML